MISTECPDVVHSFTYQKLKSASKNFSFCDVGNEYQLIRLLNRKAQFVAPQDLNFGAEYETRFVKGKTIYKHAERTGQFISISEVLRKTILYHDEIFNIMAEYTKLLKSFSQNGIILDGMQTGGKLNFAENTKNSKLFSDLDITVAIEDTAPSLSLSLQLHFDEN